MNSLKQICPAVYKWVRYFSIDATENIRVGSKIKENYILFQGAANVVRNIVHILFSEDI